MKIAGVRFRDNWKIYDFDASGVELAVGDQVIVDSERGQGFARVVRLREADSLPPLPREQAEEQRKKPKPEEEEEIEIDIDEAFSGAPTAEKKPSRGFRRVLRTATADDLAREEKNRQREGEAFTICQEMIAERELPMKLTRVEYSFDGSRATFFFFSETRVDFRELVKELAHKLRTRIEMRQIGVRDVARLIGGFGPCGRELCCVSFLKGFEPVSIRMAKKQEMVLNPAKISGVCGRLLCCLSYEYEMYDAVKKDVADMKETAERSKKEAEEQRIAEARREEDERRREEETRRREDDRKRQEAREKQQAGQKQGRQEKRRDQQEKKGRPQEQREKQQQQKQPKQQQQQQQQQKEQKPDTVQPGQQAEQPQQQDGEKEKSGRRRRRRFWRKKKGGGGGQPQGGEGGGAPAGGGAPQG